MILPVQIRAARGLIGLNQKDLAEKSQVSIGTIKRIEASEKDPTGNVQTIVRIQKALEALGVMFIEQDGKLGPGVRLKRPV